MGISTSDAMCMFLQQTVNIMGLPFQPSTKIVNKKSLQELEENKSKPLEKS